MMNPKISIIIPVYNAEKYLKECLESVKGLSYQNWECLLVNDGSNDHSPMICNEYAELDARFRVIHQKNCGVAETRNVGVANALGDYLFFLDSDDIILKDALNLFVEASERYPDAQMIKGTHELFDESGIREVVSPQKRGMMTHTNNREEVRKTWMYIPQTVWNMLIDKNFFESTGLKFDTSLKFGEDSMILYQLYDYVQSYATINVVTYRYRILSNSLTRTREIKHLLTVWLRIIQMFLYNQSINQSINQY